MTLVGPGDMYTIDLVGPENGATHEMGRNTEPFTASFANGTPQPINQVGCHVGGQQESELVPRSTESMQGMG